MGIEYNIGIDIARPDQLPDVISACAQCLGDGQFVAKMKELKVDEELTLVYDPVQKKPTSVLWRVA
jgi:hypothetical protein